MEEKFPKTFSQCPNCDGERRMANEVMQEQKDKGLAGEKSQAWLFSHQSMIADMSKPHIQVPVVISFYDVCLDCGTTWCIRLERVMATPQVKGTPPSPRFGKN